MTKVIKYILPFAGMLMFTACGDDSSSSPATSSQKYILDEANQKFALIYDRCYVTEKSTRWDENVDTTWFKYKFLGDTLIVFRGGNTADSYRPDVEAFDEKGENAIIMTGGKSGKIFGNWNSTSDLCYYNDTEQSIECDSKDEGVSDAIYVLKVSENNLTLSWKVNSEFCPADDLGIDIENGEGYLIGDLDFEVDEKSIKVVDCNTVKFKIDGKSVTATQTFDIASDNVATTKITYTIDKKTCTYTEREVPKFLQYPESICKIGDMESYTLKEPKYIHRYEDDSEYEEAKLCLAELFGIR